MRVLTTSLLVVLAAAAAANAAGLRQKRLVGGMPVAEGEAAYSASLQDESGEHFCGGVIVSKNTVLTSAFCAKHIEASKMRVKAGDVDLAKTSEFKVVSVEIHPDFSISGKIPMNDLAALKVSPDFDFTGGKFKAAVLPTEGQKSVQGETVTVSGWGASKVNGTAASQLMKIKIRIVSVQDCAEAYKDLAKTLPEKQICAGGEDGAKDACSRDGGAGLLFENMVLGLVSWGQGCGQKPGVYTELAPYRAWIDQHVAA